MAAMGASSEPVSPKSKKKKVPVARLSSFDTDTIQGCVAWIAEQNNKGYYVTRYDELGQSLLHIAILEDAGLEDSSVLCRRAQK